MHGMKPKYSLWQNLAFLWRNIWLWDKTLLMNSALKVPVTVALPLLGIYLSSHVVKLVTEGRAPEQIVLRIALFSVAIFAVTAITNVLDGSIRAHSLMHRFQYLRLTAIKSMDTDYENIESPAGRQRFTKAYQTMDGNNGAAEASVGSCVAVAANLFGLVTYASIITTLNPLIILFIILIAAANYYLAKRYNLWEFQSRDNWVSIDRKLSYLLAKSLDFSQAKDIRLYNMADWFHRLHERFLSERQAWYTRTANRWFAVEAVGSLLAFIRDLVVYGYLIHLLVAKGLSADSFVLYFGVIGGLSTWLMGFASEWSKLDKHSLSLCDLRDYLEMPDRFNRGVGAPLPQSTCEIEFRNVSFGYTPDELLFSNLSFTIGRGEKFAIVGHNGAGKTTLIKLLCGFYAPTAGEILVGGRNILEYNRTEYHSLFAAVFQDMNLLPISLRDNITSGAPADDARVREVVRLAGLAEKTDALPQGLDSRLGKSLYDDAIELSGGETQKLALARALYKGGHILVLDEPTAALDPIAESAMYEQYHEMSTGKTSIFISHRLASTRFCDRICLIENGSIVESGTHDTLMAQGGKYSAMFEIQSHYYKQAAGGEADAGTIAQ